VRIRIRHETTYTYGAPVMLQPQRIRLRPREGPGLTLIRHELRLSPPVRPRWSLDADGNSVATCWFARTTRTFEVTVEAEVSTALADPYDFLLEPAAIALPVRLTPRELRVLAPALERSVPVGRADAVAALGAEVGASAGTSTIAFVAAACRAVSERLTWLRRTRGRARAARITLSSGRGACRDSAVLLCDVLRSAGLPARFVSGYAAVPAGSPASSSFGGDDLHAWTEVYLPGAGWRGFDPTRGLAVDERYVPLAASAEPDGAAPISGGFIGPRGSKMKARVEVAEVAGQDGP
jgi:transglutaminase-like putative cysteine protease